LDADDAEIPKAAEAAKTAEFVDGLPQGYDTLVGERGVKPRVVSASRSPLPARWLRGSPILVLDIREDGSHAQLLTAGNTYASLWQQQSGGFLGVPA
jgi:ABC-type multidrug transport system fused ATPase/permease subunit